MVLLPGNYDDYLLYQSRRKEESKQDKTEAKQTPKDNKQQAQAKLSWKEKQELDGMEARILEAEEAVAQLEELVHKPEFYEQPHTVIQEKLAKLQVTKENLNALFARWEELEARK